MKELIRELRTGKRKVNVTNCFMLLLLLINIGYILSDVILICMGATFTWLGFVLFVAKFFVAQTCYDYLFED